MVTPQTGRIRYWSKTRKKTWHLQLDSIGKNFSLA